GEEDSMRRILVAACLAGSLVALAPSAMASGPIRESIPVDQSTLSPFFTAACGFDVFLTQVGTLKAAVAGAAAGPILREIDTQPGFTFTFSSPDSGRSFSFHFVSPTRTTYTDGAVPGSTAIVTGVGLVRNVPGIPPDAGRIVFPNATVLFLDSAG